MEDAAQKARAELARNADPEAQRRRHWKVQGQIMPTIRIVANTLGLLVTYGLHCVHPAVSDTTFWLGALLYAAGSVALSVLQVVLAAAGRAGWGKVILLDFIPFRCSPPSLEGARAPSFGSLCLGL